MFEKLDTCKDAANHIREQMLLMMNEGTATDFLIIERLLRQTMELKKDIDRFITAKEIDK